MTEDNQRIAEMIQTGLKALLEVQNKYAEDELLVSRCSRAAITMNTVKRTIKNRD